MLHEILDIVTKVAETDQ